jgi:folate-binding protein YgfZ
MTIAMPAFTALQDRGVIHVAGPDAVPFLQGIVSNDVAKVAPVQAIHAAFLTAQGKYLHDFFIAPWEVGLIIDCEAPRAADLEHRLSMYKLRAQISIEQKFDLTVYATFGVGTTLALGLEPDAGAATSFNGGIAFNDPRLSEAGARIILPIGGAEPALMAAGFNETDGADYDRHRLNLGLPDGSRDMEVDKSILLECGFEELNGVDFDKGCYLGQEVTARTKHRGLVKKRLLPVDIDGPPPEPGTPLMLGDIECGEMRSSSGDVGLALIRIERFAEALAEGKHFTAPGATIKARRPSWAKF